MKQFNKTENPNNSEHVEIDLGERKVSKMNFSHIITLPKDFVNSPLGEIVRVKLTMLEDGSLKITPKSHKNTSREFSVF